MQEGNPQTGRSVRGNNRPLATYPHTLSVILLVTIFLVAGILRYYRLSVTIRFADDQGLDMVSIWQMQKTGTLPLVGPFLSLPDVHTPPTYYFINWFLYTLTHSVTGLVYAYALINLVTMAILVRLAYEMKGIRMAILTGIVFAVSTVMIDHSRSFWQPYPIQLFLSLSLLFLWRMNVNRSVLSLWAGVFFYAVAVSVYPSPILLLPLVCWHLVRWYRINRGLPIASSLMVTVGVLMVPFLLLFSPQLYFEFTRGFPTLMNVFAHHDELLHISPTVSVMQNLTELITIFFATDRLPYPHMFAATIVLIALCFVLVWSRLKQVVSPVTSFFPLWAMLAGICGFLFYPFEVHGHRAWAFLPYAFLAFADQVDGAIVKKGVFRVIGLVLLGSYISINLHGGWHYWTGKAGNTIALTKEVARFISDDMRHRRVADTDAGFFYKVPNDPQNGSYGIYRILFWLLRDGNHSFPLDTANIHLPHDYSTPVLKPYMYIICRGFDSDESIRDHCVGAVIMEEQYTTLRMQQFQNITVVVLRALPSSVSSLHVSE